MTTKRSAAAATDLLPRVRSASAFHEPSRRVDLVCAVDGDVELFDRVGADEHLHREAELARRGGLGGDGGRDAPELEPRSASAGSRNATVDPVPRPTRIPSSTSSAAASAAARFSASMLTGRP